MPIIATFYGIIIRMFYNDHAPAHFHVKYGEHEAIIDIRCLHQLKGSLPRRALELVLDWAELHQSELLDNWALAEKKEILHKIEPLN